MVVVAGEGDPTCPVMAEWVKMEELVKRATSGRIALCKKEAIDRSTVADNYELLTPLVTHYGILLCNKCY